MRLYRNILCRVQGEPPHGGWFFRSSRRHSPCLSGLRYLPIFCLLAWAVPLAAAEPDVILKLNLHGETIVGRTLLWSPNQAVLLGRDGWMWTFPPDEGTDYRRVPGRFEPISASQMRNELQQRFGQDFDVTTTGHYVVVHPRGSDDPWSERFEELYRSFVYYFGVRGLEIRDPEFPLVAVVLPDRRRFVGYASQERVNIVQGVLGYYNLETNRIALYDRAETSQDNQLWYLNAGTIIHEATHQTSYNTGVQSRWAPSPVWVSEGLATLFEARGVWDYRRPATRADRINNERFEIFLRYAETGQSARTLAELVRSDQLFQINPAIAYSQAWALTFYLSETAGRDYADYLVQTTARPPFAPYRETDRLRDFTNRFGSDWNMLDARIVRFMRELADQRKTPAGR